MEHGEQLPDILGLTWEESKTILEDRKVSYTVLISRPPNHQKVDDTRRVIRTRWLGSQLEVVLADERFPREQIKK